MKISVDENKCVGCRSCELACSIYCYGYFDPSKSLIQINLKENGKICISNNNCICNEIAYCDTFCPLHLIKLVK